MAIGEVGVAGVAAVWFVTLALKPGVGAATIQQMEVWEYVQAMAHLLRFKIATPKLVLVSVSLLK